MPPTSALAALDAAPRFELGHWPTPLTPCHRLREAVGGPLVWLKRDDCSGLALGGNKTRKLEHLVGRALADGCTGIVTFGALQSNHARQTAAACAAAGLTCDLILTRSVARADEHYGGSGNLLLDRVLGATVHLEDDDEAAGARWRALRDRAADDGRRLHLVGPGGSDPIGTLGYVRAALELGTQLDGLGLDVDRIVVAASTGGTAAGLLVGLALDDRDVEVDIACVYRPADRTAEVVDDLAAATAAMLGGHDLGLGRRSVDDAALGDGYGIPSASGRDAIELLARTEGVLLDPVYTGKAFAHLVRRITEGALGGAGDVVFVHTGGAPGLFAYAPEWPPT